jgi:hypothetical protein
MKATNFTLTDHQINFFKTFGYLSFPGLMADRAEGIVSAFEAVWEEHGGGHNGRPHEGTARSCIVPFIDQSEYLSSLLDDPRILGIATTLLGDDFNYMGSDGNYYVGDTGWHSDGGHKPEDPMHIKIAFYLDRLTRDTGALRVIPGSHLFGDGYAQKLSEEVRQSQDLWGIHGRDVPAVAFETEPGDVALFNHNTKHSAFGGSTRRRMFTMNLCQRYPEDRLDDLRKYISGSARFWIDRKYGEKMVRTAGPERMTHLEQAMANDGHLAELSRQARERMSEPSRG